MVPEQSLDPPQTALLRRTSKAQDELRSRGRTLPLRERSILFLADGSKTAADVEAAIGADARPLIEQLLGSGYLELRKKTTRQQGDAAAAAQLQEGDTLSGRRSLAGTRMYLFDVCERTFSRGAPTTAQSFRDRLRTARERSSMLAVADEMLAEIETLAGSDRARTVRERIAALLPEEEA